MADITMIVDQNVVLPVNKLPLVDATDKETIETAVAYNASGLVLIWNFVTTSGVVSRTQITPSTGGGNYDWNNDGNGMYSIDFPAIGSYASNDTTGTGWFTGYATGVYLWSSPLIEFVPNNVANALVDGTDRLEVDAWEMEGLDISDQLDNEWIHKTTIATIESTDQKTITLTAGNPVDDSYNYWTVLVKSASNSTKKFSTMCSDYVGGTSLQVTLYDDPNFTLTIGDSVSLVPPSTANLVKVNNNSNAAIRFALTASRMVPGTVTTAVTTTSTTQFSADDVTEATADHYNGRLILFTSGVLDQQITRITDYSYSGGVAEFTVVGMTEAPSDNDTFIII